MIYFLDHNMKLNKMIEIHLKYDNIHTNIIINAFTCINDDINSSTNCMLSADYNVERSIARLNCHRRSSLRGGGRWCIITRRKILLKMILS